MTVLDEKGSPETLEALAQKHCHLQSDRPQKDGLDHGLWSFWRHISISLLTPLASIVLFYGGSRQRKKMVLEYKEAAWKLVFVVV